MSRLGKMLDQLPPEKRALLELRLARETSQGSAPESLIQPRDPRVPTPLSYAQQRLWFLHRLGADGGQYNVTRAVRVSGPLDQEALAQALNNLVKRHEVLRTTYHLVNGSAQQRVDSLEPVDLPCTDLSTLDGTTRQSALRENLEIQAAREFDLANGLMIRAHLYRLEAHAHILLLVLHHVASDAWSMDIAMRELAAFYAAAVSGREAELPTLPFQYADYAIWERQRLDDAGSDAALAYWQAKLARLPILDLPTDRSRPATPSYRGGQVPVSLPLTVIDPLRRLAQSSGGTLYMVLLTLLAVLLHRYSRQDDIAIGSPVAGRGHAGTECLIGAFINTLVMRCTLSDSSTFRDTLAQTRETVLQAFSHQEVPFEHLVETLNPERDRSRHPLTQVMMVLHNTPTSKIELGGLSFTQVAFESHSAKFDLTLALEETPNGLEGIVEYASDLFDQATIERLRGHLRQLAVAVAADPDTPIGRLSMLTEHERRQILYEWNQTQRPYPASQCLHWLFEAQSEQRPDALAVVAGNRSVTYAELNRQANRIAHRLIESGVQPGDAVGLCARPSPETMAGILAILKAGAAYVPMDPEYPTERICLMVEDAAMSVVLVDAGLEALVDQASVQILPLTLESTDTEPDRSPEVTLSANDPAYVIYTSGSSGRPKGVVVCHRAVTRLVVNTDYIELGPEDRVAQVSSISFDAATFEIWGALLHGGCLVILERDQVLMPSMLAQSLSESRVTTLFLTTALFNRVAQAQPAAFEGLRTVLFGGEASDVNAVRQVLANRPPERLMHVYGPTECTTFATAHLVTQLGAGARTVPIGLPIANTTAYVLGPEMQPVPVGVPGELYLGGHGLAHGYLGQPELTATSFVDDPFRPQAGERLYRTGDLVRRHGDASIEFIGRLDKQIKLRGFRIEPGEIEAVLLKQDGVRDAVVVPLKGEADKDLQLVAYVVPDSQPGPSEDTLRAELKLYLPSFMLPTNLVTLKELPLNANGKVDRTRLPKPAPRRPDPGTGGAKPVNAVEQALAEIWAEVLGVDSVPADADFFALGGHSLLATRLLSEVESRFNVRLPLSKLFEQPTVRGVATTLKNDNWGAQWKSLVPVNAKGNRRPFFCVHGDPSALAPHLDADQPYYWLHHAQDGSLVGYATVEEIATDHLKEIRTVQPHGPYLLGGFSFGGLLAFEITRELRQAGERVDLLAMFDPPHPPLPQNIKAQLKTIGKRKQPAVRRMVGAIKMRFRRITGSIKHLLGSLQISLAMVSGKPLPTDIRTEYLVRIFRSASRQYGYAPIPGSATIFVHGGGYATDTGRMRLQAAWESVTKEPVDLRIIPEVPTHGALFQEPYVGRLAAELNALLEASQVEQPDAGPGQ